MVRRLRRLAAVPTSALLAGLLLSATPALPALAPGPVDVVAREVPISLERQQVVTLPIAATDVELHWHGSPDARVSIALATVADQFGPEIPLDADADADAKDGTPSDGETYGDVIWAAGSRFVRVTSDRPIGHLVVVAFKSDGPGRLVPVSGPVVQAALNEPAVITRAGWGANESYRFDAAGHEIWPPGYSPIQKFVVHHTAGRNGDPNPAATVRAIYYMDTVLRGWGDLGYNYLIDEAGHIYEGRHARAYASGETPTEEDLAGNGVRGAHAKSYNDGTIGIAVLGTFDTQLPTAAAQASLQKLIAWQAERHGISPTGSSTYTNPETGLQKFLPNIVGHRNVGNTDCPGTLLYAALPSLRTAIANRIAASTGSSVDHTAPTVRSLTPLVSDPTGGSSISFGLVFSEPVSGLTTGSFAVGGSSSGWSVSSLTGVASTYTVTLAASTPADGSITLTLPAGSVTDRGGNAGPASPAVATANYALDQTAPTVSLYATPSGGASNTDYFVVTVTFSEPVAPITAADITVGGSSNAATPWSIDPVVGSGAHYGFSIQRSSPANGTLTLAIAAAVTTDPGGNPNVGSGVHSVVIDRTVPTTGPPVVHLRPGVTLSSTALPVTVTWAAADLGGSGIRSYDLARSIDGGTFAIVYGGITTRTVQRTVTAGHSYRFEARTRDWAGNVSAWAVGPTFTPSLRQQSSSSIVYHGTWTTSTFASFSGGTSRYAKAAGASASLTTTARSLAFVTSLGPNRGAVKVYVDGTLRATLDLFAATTTYRRVAFAWTWSTAGTHSIKIVVVGTAGRPRVDLDAIEILR